LLRHVGKFQHPNIVRLLDICHGPRGSEPAAMTLYLVFEHLAQDLTTFLARCPPPGLPQSKVRDLAWQTLCGLDFLHTHRIVHRDIKPQNILVATDGTLKLADFGLARIYDFNTLLTSTVVTLWYRAPEVLLGTTYATPVDMWSCGCILAELVTRRPLFPGLTETDQLTKIFSVLGLPGEESWPQDSQVLRQNFSNHQRALGFSNISEIDADGQDLLERLLRFEPGLRMTACEALKHPYFRECGPSPHDTSSSSDGSSATNTSDSSVCAMSDTSASAVSDSSAVLSDSLLDTSASSDTSVHLAADTTSLAEKSDPKV